MPARHWAIQRSPAGARMAGGKRLDVREAIRRRPMSLSSRRTGRSLQTGRTHGIAPSSRPASRKRAGYAPSKFARAPSRVVEIAHHAVARLRQDDGYDDRDCARQQGQRPVDTRPVHGMGGWKAGRGDAPEQRQALAPGSKIVWDIHYHSVGERDRRRRRDGVVFLSEGTGAEVPAGARSIRRDHRRAPESRYSTELDQRARSVSRDEAEWPHRKLPAAYASARQSHDPWKPFCPMAPCR